MVPLYTVPPVIEGAPGSSWSMVNSKLCAAVFPAVSALVKETV